MVNAFVGHSFDKKDKDAILAFKEYFNALKKTMPFTWDDAEEVEVKGLSKKVRDKMEGKNLFIGILTKKQVEIEKENLSKPKFFHKNKLYGKGSDFKWGTSYWIIQESGYAIGKGMLVLFLIEEGVKKPEGLHADVEYIPFQREKESESFKSLAEALGSLHKEISGEPEAATKDTDLVSPPQKSEEPQAEKKEVSSKIEDKKEQGEQKDYLLELIRAMHAGNKNKIKELKEEILEVHKENSKEILYWKTKILHFESIFLKKNVLDELNELNQNNPNNPDILNTIAYELEKYSSYGDAADTYLESSKYELQKKKKLSRIGDAAKAYAKNSRRKEAVNILLGELKETLSREEQCIIYKSLATIFEILREDNLYAMFSEKTLLLDPSDNSLRFDLAYKYGSIGKDAFSLYHYKILTQNNPADANLNNIGVAYERLKMKGTSIQFYRKACEKGSTLAHANLAQRLLNEGFSEEANQEIQKAIDKGNYEKDNIGRALSRIETTRENEKETENKTLNEIEDERNFYLEYADAYSKSYVVDERIDGKWKSKHGFLNIHLESGNIFKGEAKELIPETTSSSLSSLLGGGTPTMGLEGKKEYSTKIICFEGSFESNRALKYEIKIEIQPSNKFASKKMHEFSGRGIVNKDLTIIKIKETDKDGNVAFYDMLKQ